MANKKAAKTAYLVFSLMLTVFFHTSAQISLNSTSFATVGTGVEDRKSVV